MLCDGDLNRTGAPDGLADDELTKRKTTSIHTQPLRFVRLDDAWLLAKGWGEEQATELPDSLLKLYVVTCNVIDDVCSVARPFPDAHINDWRENPNPALADLTHFIRGIGWLLRLADEGWRLLKSYGGTLTRVAGGPVTACGTTKLSAHEVALTLADEILIGLSGVAEGGVPWISTSGVRRESRVSTEFLRIYAQSLTPEGISEEFEQINKEFGFLQADELDSLRLQVDREYVLAKELTQEGNVLPVPPGDYPGGGTPPKSAAKLQHARRGGDDDDQDTGGSGMTWQEARDKAEEIRLQGEPFTSYPKMAGRIRCSQSTLHKAIDKHGTVEQKDWAAKQRGASRLNVAPEVAAVAFESTPQTREPDPADVVEDEDIDAALAYVIEQAEKSGPAAVARIYDMPPAERRRLAETAFHDPDLQEQIDRRRRAKKRSRRD